MVKKKASNGSDANGVVPKKKEWRIVSWSQEEDDILREQIRTHGTENWGIIASKFHDKTARQCRRRWFTYLNSVFKKGGWSPEEDMLLCEAQKIFGNRWTEIAKVVSGRTDNAVKNRFATLCRRRAKNEALAKENNFSSYINLNNKRVIFPNEHTMGGDYDSGAPLKRMRFRNCVMDATENRGEITDGGECDVSDHLRHPFGVLAQKTQPCSSNSSIQLHSDDIKNASADGSENNEIEGMFLKKDDLKVLVLIQQAELLSSLAIKVNSEKMDQSVESACMARPSWREPDLYELSPASSEYSTGSTLLSNVGGDTLEECKAGIGVLHQDTGNEFQSIPLDSHHSLAEENGICHTAGTDEADMLMRDNIKDNNEATCEYSKLEFGSPVHVTPLFRALAAAIPSPKFSESEKHFLMKTLGMESTSPSPITTYPSQPPCKRSLLHCL